MADKRPGEPSACRYNNVTATSVYITFSDPADDGGDAIDLRQIAYRKTTDAADDLTNVSSDKSTTITGLTPGTAYYFWARVHNSVGYGTYGPRITVTTLNHPDAPGIVSFSEVTQISLLAKFVDGDTNGSPVTARQIGYSTNPVTLTPTTVLTYSGATRVTGLAPYTRYYFRSRTKNAIGYSSWSASSTVITLAGARINVNGVWKSAIPYVKVAGVWKVARPWGRQFGYWEEST
jgi:hypothetical protein